jgi:hypothetical protein
VPYAVPHERLPIRHVTQRLFRGRCEFIGHMDATIELFNREREAIEAALVSGGVSEQRQRKRASFLAKFYEIINDPELRERYVDGRCIGSR